MLVHGSSSSAIIDLFRIASHGHALQNSGVVCSCSAHPQDVPVTGTLCSECASVIAVCNVCRFGEDHRSLTDVLQDLQGQLKGQEPKLLPGQTLSRPLHVILQVSLHGPMLLMGALLLQL